MRQRGLRSVTVSSNWLRWLVSSPGNAPAEVKDILLGQLRAAPGPLIFGSVTGIIVTGVALHLDPGGIFVILLALQIWFSVFRIIIVPLIYRITEKQQAQPIDLKIIASILWCLTQGLMTLFGMRTNIPEIQILTATTIMSIVGPIGARNYQAPRLAFLLITICDLFFIAGVCLSGRLWLLILLPMTPPFLFAAWQTVGSHHRMALTSLCAEWDSRYRAHHDSMTGLLNRRAFNETMAQLSKDPSGAFALLCLDLDGFKAVNDSLGHEAGDRLLTAVAARLLAGVRDTDSVFRLGGDEFGILMHGLESDAIGTLAERIIEQVSAGTYEFDGLPPIHVGVSIGFACYPDDGRDIHELHHQADLALYKSKSAGKGVQTRFQDKQIKAVFF